MTAASEADLDLLLAEARELYPRGTDGTLRDRLVGDLVDAVLSLRAGGDAHHTMDELYEYRMLYNAHAANEWARHDTYPVVKSRLHSNGEPCFGGGWFIIVATLPTGQVSNHYRDEFWPLFVVPEVDLPPGYDGHNPGDAAQRLRSELP